MLCLQKQKSKELDVDFIGGENPMTKEEEKKAVDDYVDSIKDTSFSLKDPLILSLPPMAGRLKSV